MLTQWHTSAIEGGHIEHSLLISLLHFLPGYHQLYLVPFLRLKKLNIKVKKIQKEMRLQRCDTNMLTYHPFIKSTQKESKVPHKQSVQTCQSHLRHTAVLTISSHWCAFTATWVPRGLVRTNTSPGTALSGLHTYTHKWAFTKSVTQWIFT